MNINEQIQYIHSELKGCNVLLPHHFIQGVTNEGIEAYCERAKLNNFNLPIMDGIDGQKLFGVVFTHVDERDIISASEFEDMGEI